MGVEWFGLVMGLGFVLSFGYWCTDFLVVQRAMATDSMSAARRTPLIAAVPKMVFPALVILPGMIALALHAEAPNGFLPLQADGSINYNMAVPVLLGHYLPQGLLGLGLTALHVPEEGRRCRHAHSIITSAFSLVLSSSKKSFSPFSILASTS